MVQAIIVAAGKGSRLYPLTDNIPKVMIPIGRQDKPMAHMIIEQCMEHGIKDFLFCLNNETGKQVQNYFGDGSRFGINVDYSFSKEPQGTAGEVKLAYKRKKVKLPSLIYYGDTLCKTNLTALMAIYSDVTVVVNDQVRMPYGFIQDDYGKAIRIIEKPTIKEIVPDKDFGVGAIMSIYYVKNDLFYLLFCQKGRDISGDVLPDMMMNGYNVSVYHDLSPFVDVGNWKNYSEAKDW